MLDLTGEVAIVTEDQYTLFKEYVDYWLCELQITGWEIFFEFKKGESDCRAETWTNYTARQATFKLSSEWHDLEVTEANLDKLALHEALELLLAPMYYQADRNEANELVGAHKQAMTVAAAHSVIRRLSVLLERQL